VSSRGQQRAAKCKAEGSAAGHRVQQRAKQRAAEGDVGSGEHGRPAWPGDSPHLILRTGLVSGFLPGL
jgi:hypothetical protein